MIRDLTVTDVQCYSDWENVSGFVVVVVVAAAVVVATSTVV